MLYLFITGMRYIKSSHQLLKVGLTVPLQSCTMRLIYSYYGLIAL